MIFVIIRYGPGIGAMGILEKGTRKCFLGVIQCVLLNNYHVTGRVFGTREKVVKQNLYSRKLMSQVVTIS